MTPTSRHCCCQKGSRVSLGASWTKGTPSNGRPASMCCMQLSGFLSGRTLPNATSSSAPCSCLRSGLNGTSRRRVPGLTFPASTRSSSIRRLLLSSTRSTGYRCPNTGAGRSRTILLRSRARHPMAGTGRFAGKWPSAFSHPRRSRCIIDTRSGQAPDFAE